MLQVYLTKVYLNNITFDHLKSILKVYFTGGTILWVYFQEVCLEYTSNILHVY